MKYSSVLSDIKRYLPTCDICVSHNNGSCDTSVCASLAVSLSVINAISVSEVGSGRQLHNNCQGLLLGSDQHFLPHQ